MINKGKLSMRVCSACAPRLMPETALQTHNGALVYWLLALPGVITQLYP